MAADIICRLLAAPDAASPISSYLVPLSSVWLNILRDCDTHFSLTASSLRHCGPRNFARGGGGDEDRPSVALLPRLRRWRAGTLAEDVLSKYHKGMAALRHHGMLTDRPVPYNFYARLA